MDLTTTARIKLLGSIDVSTMDSLLGQLITNVSKEVEEYLDREAESGVARTEYLDVERHQRDFLLRAWPVASVTSIHFDPDRSFAATDLLTAADDYIVPFANDRGVLRTRTALVQLGGPERMYPGALKVIYTGGMAANAGAFVTAFPDIAGAVDLQVFFLLQRRHELGLQAVSGDGGSVTSFEPVQLLPNVKQILKKHRRMI